MVQPINYFAAMPQIDIAGQLGEIGDIFGKRMQQRQAQEQARQAQEQYARDLQEAFRVANPQAFAQLIAKYPGQREALGDAAKLVQQDVLDNDWKQGLQIASALENNAPDVARRILQERVDAAKNAGDDPGIYGQILSSVEAGDIQGARGATNFALSLVDPKRFGEFATSLTAAQKRPAEVAMAGAQARTAQVVAATEPQTRQAQIDNVISQIQERAARLGLDQDKLLSEIQMKQDELSGKKVSETAQKQITESQANAVMAEQAAVSMSSLADRLEQLGGGYGRFANLAEWWAGATGNQDALSQARTDYVRIRNAAAIKALPPGVATDKDIELALKGFPPETADSQYLASFLRGTAKLQAAEAAFEDVKSQWIDSVGYLGKPRQDIEVGGVKVPAGTTLVQFWNKQGEKFISQVQSRNAMKKYEKYSGGASGSY